MYYKENLASQTQHSSGTRTTQNQENSKSGSRAHTHQNRSWDFGISQGFTQGAYLFICYTSTLSEIVPESLNLDGFAENH